jgi:hypothetical protein
MTVVWSNGGGTQSAAIAVLILTGKLPKPDIVVMSDTSREVTETWDYLRNVVQPELTRFGCPVEVIPHSYSTVDIATDDGTVLIPAFTTQNGKVGKLPTYCSSKWKQYPVRRYLRELGVKECDLWLGISTDEIERMKDSDVKWTTHVYPLIEIVRYNRRQCVAAVKDYGWPTPPKSRCWMCPNMSPQSWRDLSTHYPDDFKRAVELEGNIQLTDPHIFLHSTGKPLAGAIVQEFIQGDMFDSCDSGFCFT